MTPCRWRVVPMMFAVIGALVALANGVASPAKVRLVDRTYTCSVPVSGGIRQLAINAQSGVREQGGSPKWLALSHASIYLGADSSFGVQAGGPRAEGGVPQPESTLWMDTTTCRRSSIKVRLPSAGLNGGRANQFPERYKCTTPIRVLVRIRAEFRSPASLGSQAGVVGTPAPVKAGSIAVRTESGKAIALSDVLESGRTRLFLAARCHRE